MLYEMLFNSFKLQCNKIDVNIKNNLVFTQTFDLVQKPNHRRELNIQGVFAG